MKEALYKVLDFINGKKGLWKTVNGFTLKLPTRYINYFPADYEHENFEFLRKHVKPGDSVLDIGAHIGLFATAAAQLSGNNGKVYAFEPADLTNALLRQTIHINHMEHVIEWYSEAIGAASGKVTFYVSDIRGDNSNSTVSYKSDRKLHPKEVPMLSIDDFVKNKNVQSLRLIKLDVEGAEYDALRGAVTTLKQLRPVCIIAIHPEPIIAKGDSLEKIFDLIIDCKYEIYYQKKVISKAFFCNNKEMIDLHILPV